MHFSDLERNIYAYICGEEEEFLQQAQTLLQDYVAFCCKKEEADVLVGETVPEDYDVTGDVPFLCLDQGYKGSNCYVWDGSQESLTAWLDAAVLSERTKARLYRRMPFAAVCGSDDPTAAERLFFIVQADERLNALGIAQKRYADHCKLCVVFLEESMLHDGELAAWCAGLSIPVMAILDGVSEAQAKEFFGGFAALCPAYDLWQINNLIFEFCDVQALRQDRDFYAGVAALAGFGRPRDILAGTRLLKRSAQMGNVRAMLNRSLCRMYAVGEQRDLVKSDRMLQQAAQTLLEQKQDRDLADIVRLASVSEDIVYRFLLRGDVQHARVIATQAHRLCADFLAENECDEAKLACAQCALQAADIAFDCEDVEAYAQLYLDYAQYTFEAAKDEQIAEEILSNLDTIAGHLAKDETKFDQALRCADIGVMWQQYLTGIRGGVQDRAALASYLELRAELHHKKNDARAMEDYRACIALCREDAKENDRAARFHAKCHLSLAHAMYDCGQAEEALQMFETAQNLWKDLYDAQSDAASASALCACVQGYAMAAAACEKENAVQVSDAAIDFCAGLADSYRAGSVWESLARSYGVRAKLVSPSEESIDFYNEEASIWHQLHSLTFEEVYAKNEKQALALAKQDQKTLAPPTPWQKFTQRFKKN